MAVANNTLAAILRGEMDMGGERLGNFRLDGLGKQLPRAFAQDFGKGIGKLTRLTQADDGIGFHGVSILSGCVAGSSPPRYAAPLSQPSHQHSRITPILGNVKSALLSTFRAISAKHAPRALAEFDYRFNRRFDLAAMIPRLARVALCTSPMPYRLLKLAEDCR
jgi:hypothetical protein